MAFETHPPIDPLNCNRSDPLTARARPQTPLREASLLSRKIHSFNVRSSHVGICSDYARHPSCAVMFRGGVQLL
jgi:hypothetical protein